MGFLQSIISAEPARLRSAAGGLSGGVEKFFARGARVMDKATFENKLRELAGEFGASICRYEALAKAAKQRTTNSEHKDAYSDIEDSLDFLRVCIKYLRFDLDATRRENQCLRKMLDELND